MPIYDITTEYTENIIIKYCTRHILSKKAFLIAFFITIPVGIILTSLYLALVGYSQVVSFLLILFIAVGVMVPLSWYFIPRKTVKRQSGVIGRKQNFKFYEKELKITSITEDSSQERTFTYDSFLLILEAKDACYFYADKNQAYILDTAQLSEKDASDLKNFIHTNIDNKKIKYV